MKPYRFSLNNENFIPYFILDDLIQSVSDFLGLFPMNFPDISLDRSIQTFVSVTHPLNHPFTHEISVSVPRSLKISRYIKVQAKKSFQLKIS